MTTQIRVHFQVHGTSAGRLTPGRVLDSVAAAALNRAARCGFDDGCDRGGFAAGQTVIRTTPGNPAVCGVVEVAAHIEGEGEDPEMARAEDVFRLHRVEIGDPGPDGPVERVERMLDGVRVVLVGDDSDRFWIEVDGLAEEVEAGLQGDALAEQYAAWCREWGADAFAAAGSPKEAR